MDFNLSFYNKKKVFVTGHTGFKGSWLCKILSSVGAEVMGYSLSPPTSPSLFEIAKIGNDVISVIGDIRDYKFLKKNFDDFQPEVVFHLAAQPIVRDSYKNPAYTYEVNVMGTINVLECIRSNNCVRSFINVTTDKVYLNKEWEWGYRENEELDGYDPYSNSKSCSELLTHSYKNSFFENSTVAISTVRAGNVIGGGDFANDRIIPDCIRAAIEKKNIIVRNPFSIRPYQHVLEPLYVYLMIAAKQYENGSYAGYYNVGPDEQDCFQTGLVVDLFVKYWGNGLKRINKCDDNSPHEATYLKLECSKLKATFNWKPRWDLNKAIEKVVEWNKCWLEDGDIRACMDKEIEEFLSVSSQDKMIKSKVSKMIESLQIAMKEESVDPTKGLPEDLFLFASTLMPCANIDLFIVNKKRQVLLTWRDDIFYGKGWHIPGGCIRMKEKLDTRIQKTALNELGSKVIYQKEPMLIRESMLKKNRPEISNQLVRAHNISLLYKCKLPENFNINNKGLAESDAGYAKWFDSIPNNLLEAHKELYGDVLESWFGGTLE